jgi:hypothetical protein
MQVVLFFRGSRIAQFLLDGDASVPLKKTAQDLKKFDRYGLEFCHKMTFRYSKQLFAIYQSKEDPYFPRAWYYLDPYADLFVTLVIFCLLREFILVLLYGFTHRFFRR